MPTYLPPFDIADDALAKQWRQWQPKDFAPNGGNGKNDKNGKHAEVVYEASDLIYHLTVLLVQQGVTLDDLYEELKARR